MRLHAGWGTSVLQRGGIAKFLNLGMEKGCQRKVMAFVFIGVQMSSHFSHMLQYALFSSQNTVSAKTHAPTLFIVSNSDSLFILYLYHCRCEAWGFFVIFLVCFFCFLIPVCLFGPKH